MWGAITKDFGEFVSTVAADATETLESIDQTLDEPLVKRSNNNRRSTEEGGDFTDEAETVESEALIDPDTGIPLSSIAVAASSSTPIPLADVPWKSPTEATLEEMKERLLVSCEDVFRDPLLDNDIVLKTSNADSEMQESDGAKENAESHASTVKTFLENFDVATKTEEISELLKLDAALQTTFSILSDSVTYADFWTRYFYRIEDSERLLETYSIYYQRHLQARAKAAELELLESQRAQAGAPRAAAAMGGLTSFLGGVVSKLTNENDTEDDPNPDTSTDYEYADTSGVVDESLDQTTVDSTEDGAVAAARSALGFLSSTVAGASGRPPFVMNTAVSDDDDEYDDELQSPPPDEDSEVELGWDDDDDEDFDGLDDDDEDNGEEDVIAFQDGDDRSETVDFKDAEKEGLLEELEQAREERDALQKTVQMQADELKKALAAAAQVSSNAAQIVTPSDDNIALATDDAIQALKLELFEKDAELAALRSKLDDQQSDGDENVELQEQVGSLKQALEAKDQDFEALKKATQAQTMVFEEKLQEQSKQQQELKNLKESLSARDQQIENLQTTMQDEASKLQHKVDEKQVEKEEMILALQSQIYALKRQLEEKKTGDQEETEDLTEKLRTSLTSKEAENSMLESKANEALAKIEKLQAQLVARAEEADANKVEIQELRAKLDANTQETGSSLVTIEQLQTDLLAKSKEIEATVAQTGKLQSMVSELESQLAAKTKEAVQASAGASQNQTRFAELESQVSEKEKLQKSLETKLQSLQNELSICQEEGQQKLQQVSDQHSATTLGLETKLSSLSENLVVSKEETNKARQEAESLRSELEQLRASFDRPTSPGSSSTGVRVDVPLEAAAAPPAIPTTPNAAVALGLEPSENNDDDDDDDGWGDDW